MATNINRDFNINFSIEDVKKNIDSVISKKNNYQLNNKNDIFNSYTITLVNGLEVIPINIQLKKINEIETNIAITSSKQIRNAGHEILVNRTIDSFLDFVAKNLSGETITNEAITPKSKSDLIVTLLVFGLGAIALTIVILIFGATSK